MQAFNIYSIPPELGNPLGALYLDIGSSDYVAFYDEKLFYILELGDKGTITKMAKYDIVGIVSLVSIIKGYVLVINTQQKLSILDIRIEMKNEQPKIVINFFQEPRHFTSYFLREVSVNMIELQIFNFSEKTKNILIYQFTIKQKSGIMEFQLDKTNKIIKENRKQLYASKSFFDPYVSMIIKLKNFGDNNFSAKKTPDWFPCHVFGVCKKEDYYGINKEFVLINLQNPGNHKKLSELKEYSLTNSIAHINYLLLENDENVALFVVEERKVTKIGTENKGFHWQISTNGKMVGISYDRTKFKVVQKNPPLTLSTTPPLVEKTDDQKRDQKKQEKKQEVKDEKKDQKEGKQEKKTENAENPPPFKPKRIVQKNKISISKSIEESEKKDEVKNESENSSHSEPQKQSSLNSSPKKELDKKAKSHNMFENPPVSEIFSFPPPPPPHQFNPIVEGNPFLYPTGLFESSSQNLFSAPKSSQNKVESVQNYDLLQMGEKEEKVEYNNEDEDEESESSFKEIIKENDAFKEKMLSKVSEIPSKIINSMNEQRVRNPLPDYQTIGRQAQKQTRQAVKDYMTKKVQDKVNSYFKGVMMDSKKIYDKTLEYYSNKSKESIHSLQIQFEEQHNLVDEAKIISGDLFACIQDVVNEGEESSANLLKEWEKSVAIINKKLDKNVEKLQNYQEEKSANHKQKILDSLSEIREGLQKGKRQEKKKVKKHRVLSKYDY